MLAKHSDDFVLESKPEQPRKRFRCLHCNYTFCTKLGAMVDHAACHERDDFIKIYSIRNGRNEGGYRPEHHAFCGTNNVFFGGSDASLDHVLLPASSRCVGGKIWCRYCDKKSWRFEGRTARELGVTVGYIRKHEMKCRAKKTQL